MLFVLHDGMPAPVLPGPESPSRTVPPTPGAGGLLRVEPVREGAAIGRLNESGLAFKIVP